jgi:hypothetical protein
MTKKERELLDDVFLQPWFLPKVTALQVKAILPPGHRHRMKFYFDDYGCICCRKRNATYGSNGFCKRCLEQVKLRLFFAVKRRWTAAEATNVPRMFSSVLDAQRLLKDLITPSGRVRRARSR